jgi:hypothetical protein
VRVSAKDLNVPKVQGHLSSLTTKPGREDISTEKQPRLYCIVTRFLPLSFHPAIVVLDSAPVPHLSTASSPLKANTPSANRTITLQLIFPHPTIGFHGLMIKIIHLNRFRLAVVAPMFAPLNSVGLRIRNPIPIHVLLALVLARNQRFPWPIDRNVASNVTMAVIDIVPITL